MKLSDLYHRKEPGPGAGPASSKPGATQKRPSPSPGPAPTQAPGPSLELPPGAPPELARVMNAEQVQVDPMALAPGQNPTLDPIQRDELRRRLLLAMPAFATRVSIAADTIPFVPDHVSRGVQKRLDQGPHVYRSQAEKDRVQAQGHPVTQASADPGAKIRQPDMSKPGRFLKDESRPYRPGA